jgi:ATP-dependent Lon protease
MCKAKVENPVILLDEIDKISRAREGSLQDVIMEVLDPVQNSRFKDEYMDIEIDLSKILFIATANSLDTIFPPLLDRLERIEVPGYTTGEKLQIFKRHVQKSIMSEAGLPVDVQASIEFTEEALMTLIDGYCKETGVRSLVRKTSSVFNKIALKYVRKE